MKKGPNKTYTFEQKAQALALGEKIGYRPAAKQLGFPLQTLRYWKGKYKNAKGVKKAQKEVIISPEVVEEFQKDATEVFVENVDRNLEKIEKYETDLLDEFYNTALLGIKRMKELIIEEKDLHKVAGAVKIVTDGHNNIMKRKYGSEDDGKKEDTRSPQQYVENLNQLILKK